jgi:gliding motility-associated-like protein
MNTICRTVALIILLFAGRHALAQNFITQWNLATAGSGATQLSFGTATSGSVNYTWQEISPGSASGSGSWSGSTLTITGLPTGATIRLQIAPTNFQRIIINSGTDSNRLTLVEQWGGTAWTSMQRAFYDCQNLQITATDVPNLSGVTDMSSMFESCRNLNSPSNIGTWNTANVTNMTFMFYDATVFNQDLGAWNTAAVTNMSTMFSEALAFNQDIGSWNTAAVTDMSDMFGYTTAFNHDIGSWNTGAVTDMSVMFRSASAFNQDISSWNTAAVTDMRSMFRLAVAFNQNIGVWELHPTVDLRNIFDDSGMGCNNYSATLIGWSANPSTPNGRQLGATGRQYGTNAVAARANLTATKGWTITGDTPSGTVCTASVPTITSFTPTSGPVGTTVIITGTNFDTTPANNAVSFNSTTAGVTASSTTSITTTVPAGATTGKITVTVTGNTATSTLDFTVSSTANQPPIIESTTTAVPIEGIITLDLETLISDPDDNLDPNSLYLVNSVSEQGASASLDDAFILTLDYGGVQFFGTDRITIGVCDILAECAEQELTIEVGGDVVVYNAVSADGNGLNDTFFLQYIDILPNTARNHVSIFNRWGDLVFEITDYNNQDRVFTGLNKNGNELPTGTYYYKIEYSDKIKTGYLSLKR